MNKSRVSDLLRYVTIRILTSEKKDTNWTGSGTGFLYLIKKKSIDIPFLITNKHVLDGVIRIGLNFHITEDKNETPLPGPGKLIFFDADQIPIIRHGDSSVDLAAIPLGPLMTFAAQNVGWTPYIRCLAKENLPSPEMIASFGAVEDVIMVGYPTGIVDSINNFPVVRRGITSTPYSVNYQGKKEFLADIPVYGGSSGSPIFIMNEGSWLQNGELMGGTRFALLGVLYAGHTETVSGNIVAEPIPTNMRPVAKVEHMINLGLCIKSALIEELADQISDKNLVRPQA